MNIFNNKKNKIRQTFNKGINLEEWLALYSKNP